MWKALRSALGPLRPRADGASDYVPDLALIDSLNRAANVGEDHSDLMARLTAGTRAAFSSGGANVYLLDDSREYLLLVSKPHDFLAGMGVVAEGADSPPRIRLAGSAFYARALEATEPIVTDDFDQLVAMAEEFEGAEEFADRLPSLLRDLGVASVITVSIRSGGQLLGVVDMGRGWPFTEREVKRFGVICEQVALVLSRIEVEKRLTESESLYRALAEVTTDQIFVIDRTHGIVVANSAAGRFTGHSLKELMGSDVTAVFGPLGLDLNGPLATVTSTDRAVDIEQRLIVEDREVWLKANLVSLAKVSPGLVLGVFRDITDSKRLEMALRKRSEEVEHLATHDTLTGLPNRRAFMDALGHAAALAERGTSSALLFADIDGFKRCNDERGHAFGDGVLSTVASLLEAEVREVDVVSRIGGDEFGALLADTDAAGAVTVAERMRARVHGYGSEIGIAMDLSVGVALVEAGLTAVQVIAVADQRMYEHKAAHRGGGESVAGTWPFPHP